MRNVGLTSDEDLDGHGGLALAERRVRRADIPTLVRLLHRPNEQRPVSARPQPPSAASAAHQRAAAVVVVDHDAVLGPEDDGDGRVGVDGAVEAPGEAVGEVEPRRQTGDARQVCNSAQHRRRCR